MLCCLSVVLFNVELRFWKAWYKYVATDLIIFGLPLDISILILNTVGYSQ